MPSWDRIEDSLAFFSYNGNEHQQKLLVQFWNKLNFITQTEVARMPSWDRREDSLALPYNGNEHQQKLLVQFWNKLNFITQTEVARMPFWDRREDILALPSEEVLYCGSHFLKMLINHLFRGCKKPFIYTLKCMSAAIYGLVSFK